MGQYFFNVSDILTRERLRSSSTDRLFVPAVRFSTVGRHTFPVAGACMRNNLPLDITSSPLGLERYQERQPISNTQ